MSTVVNKSDYLATRTGGNVEDLWFHRLGVFASGGTPTAPVAGYEASYLLYAGVPCEGVTPANFEIPNNTFLGSMQQSDPGGGRQKWLTNFEAFSKYNDSAGTGTGILVLYDRLCQKGGLSATNTAPAALQGNTNSGTCTISNASPAVVTKVAHGYSRFQKVQFTTTGTLPTGLSLATDYYVISAGYGADTFQVSATSGGSAINTSSAGSGTHTVTGFLLGSLTRYADGLGNQIWVEIFTQIGATPTTITATYTDENNNVHTTQAVTFGGTAYREKTRIIRLPLAAGDKGVKAVDQTVIAGTTGTGGDYNVMIVHPLAELEVLNSGIRAMKTFEHGQPGEVEILTDAALCLSAIMRSSTVMSVIGCLHMMEK